jgi:two-component system, OmpR family, sensor histidine kinase ChvG
VRQIIVLVAVPVQRFRAVLGALVLSTTGGEIDNVLRAERQVVFMTFGFVALVTDPAVHLARIHHRTSAPQACGRRRARAPRHQQARGNPGLHIGPWRRDRRSLRRRSRHDDALYNRIDAIEAFAADVSHELKNPLTSLRSAVETLAYAKTPSSANAWSRSSSMTCVGWTASSPIYRMPRASMPNWRAAKRRPSTSPSLLESIVSYANDTRKEGQAEVSFEVAMPPPGMDRAKAYRVMGHDSRLGQVVRNLIDNARSFTRPGSKLGVRVRRVGGEVEFRVDDFGPGIRPDNLERVFERFYTDRPEGSFGSNSGLGLSISKQIVDAHRGRIWAENRYGKAGEDGEKPILGARFVVRIPAAQHA